MAVLSPILLSLLVRVCFTTPLRPRLVDMPLFATDSVATFTWADAITTTTATFTRPERRAAEFTWPRHIHNPLEIHRLADEAAATPTSKTSSHNEKEFIVTPKHFVELPIATESHTKPAKTGIHHEPISKGQAPPKPTRPHVVRPTTTSISLDPPTEIALLHEAAILHERQAETTLTFTDAGTTQVFTFTSPTGTGTFSSFTFTGTDGFPFKRNRRAETTVTATWDGSTTTLVVDPTDLPIIGTGLNILKRVTTAAPTPSAFPVHAPNNCAQACDAADVSCSSYLTSYTANNLCSSWFTSCHSFCSRASATSLPTTLPTTLLTALPTL